MKDIFPASSVTPPVFGIDGPCPQCGIVLREHKVMYVEINEACENFQFCMFETGEEPYTGEDERGYGLMASGVYARYIFLPEKISDPMSVEEFEELYGNM